MKYIVYLTTNTVNNKIYIGVHGTENPDVFDGYLGNGINMYKQSSIYNPKTPFEFAVKKYGFKAFKRAIIKTFDTEQEALDLEAELVDEVFIKREDTYNITLGGGMPPITSKIIYQYDLEGNFLKEWESIMSAANNLGVNSASIGHAVLYKTTSVGFLWSDIKIGKLDTSSYKIYEPEIPVYVYDINCEFVKKCNSMSECTKYVNDCLSHVQRSIKQGIQVKGYYVSLDLMDIYVPPKKERLSGMVHQYSLDGIYIKSFNSIKEVEREFKCTMSGINQSIKMGFSYKNYLWLRGEKQDFVKPYKPKSQPKKIGQYDINDKLVKVFNTVREARKEFPNVSKVLNGTAKHCHGYTFKYLE